MVTGVVVVIETVVGAEVVAGLVVVGRLVVVVLRVVGLRVDGLRVVGRVEGRVGGGALVVVGGQIHGIKTMVYASLPPM